MNPLEMGGRKLLEDTVNLDTQIFCRRNLVHKAVRHIQISVIKPLDKICSGECIEVCEIANHSGCRIDRPAERYLHGVVVTVTVRIVAFAEYSSILSRIVNIGMKPMGGAEVVS